MDKKKESVPLFARIHPKANEIIRSRMEKSRRALGEELNVIVLSIPNGSDPDNVHYDDVPVDLLTTKTVIATGRMIQHKPVNATVEVIDSNNVIPVEEKEG